MICMIIHSGVVVTEVFCVTKCMLTFHALWYQYLTTYFCLCCQW